MAKILIGVSVLFLAFMATLLNILYIKGYVPLDTVVVKSASLGFGGCVLTFITWLGERRGIL